MRRVLTLSTLVALLVVPQSPAATATWFKSVSAAQKAAKQKKQMIFVDLFAQWCGWCHKFEADVVPAEPFQKATADMVMLRLDTEDGADGTAFAQKYQINSLPTFVVLSEDMTVVGLIRGYAPAPDFVKILDNTIAKYRGFQKLIATESTLAKDYPKRLSLAKEFSSRQNFAQAEPRLKKLTVEKGVPPDVRDQAFYELGVGYLTQGRYADVTRTIGEFSKVQSQGEVYERATLLASDVCMAQGNLRCAVTELRNFKQRFPKSPLVANIDMFLPSIERQISTVKQQ